MAKPCQTLALIIITVLSIAKPAKAIELLFPVPCRLTETCWITNHVDLNTQRNVAEDYMCGQKASDGNLSTHISLAHRNAVKQNMPVIAAADGTITFAGDTGGACGQRVLIDHVDGWETSYCHLNPETVQVQIGQDVQAGQILGTIGNSGQTPWPRLSFAVLRNGMIFDPFSGRTALEGCMAESKPLWRGDANPLYEPANMAGIGFAVGDIPGEAILNGLVPQATEIATNTPGLSLWGLMMNVREGDKITLRIETETGDILKQEDFTISQNQDFFPISFQVKRGRELWDEGVYRGIILLTRNFNGSPITVGKFANVRLIDN
jgi:hypothetical protein